jgi:hypothetical protein
MDGFVQRELPPSGDERHFEFLKRLDGELVELTAHAGFAGPVPDPTVLVNAHVSPGRKSGETMLDDLVVVG